MSKRKSAFQKHVPKAAEWVANYLIDHPQASVDELAKAANNARQALPRPMVAAIHREFKALQRQAAIIPDVSQQFARFEVLHPKPQHVRDEQEEEVVIVESPATIPVKVLSTNDDWKAAHDKLRPHSDEAVKLRRDWLNARLDEEPGIDPQALLKQARELFGIATDENYVYATCRLAREVAGLPPLPTRNRTPKEPEMVPKQPPYIAPVALSDERLVRWVDNGLSAAQVMPKTEVPEFIGKLLSEGVPASAIKVWREVPTKVQIEVE